MKFTIQALKKHGKLSNERFKTIYNWDYVTILNNDTIACHRGDSIVRQFSFGEFAYLVVMTKQEDNWEIVRCDVNEQTQLSIDEKIFSVNEIAELLDNLYFGKENGQTSDVIDVAIENIMSVLKKHGYEYYRPILYKNIINSSYCFPTRFDEAYYYAVGLDYTNFDKGYITKCVCGGIKDLNTKKIYKYSKVFVSA